MFLALRIPQGDLKICQVFQLSLEITFLWDITPVKIIDKCYFWYLSETLLMLTSNIMHFINIWKELYTCASNNSLHFKINVSKLALASVSHENCWISEGLSHNPRKTNRTIFEMEKELSINNSNHFIQV